MVVEMLGNIDKSFDLLVDAFHEAKTKFAESAVTVDSLERVSFALLNFCLRNEKTKKFKALFDELFEIEGAVDPFTYPVLLTLRHFQNKKGSVRF